MAKEHLKYTYCVPQIGQKGIHIHIPKTAGTCINNYLQSVAPEMVLSHASANFLRGRLNSRFHDYYDKTFKFAMVRNPWDRVVSLYLFFLRHGMSSEITFDEFVYRRAPLINEYSLDLIDKDTFSQKWFLIDHKTGQVIVDFIGKMENFNHDFDYIRKQVGLKPLGTYEVINKQNDRHYSEFYNEATEEIIRRRCSWEIENFNYEFEKEMKEAG